MTSKTIKHLDETAFNELKAEAVRNCMTMGEVMNMAIRYWLENRKERQLRKRSLLDFSPYDWGKGTARASHEIDELLYGREA